MDRAKRWGCAGPVGVSNEASDAGIDRARNNCKFSCGIAVMAKASVPGLTKTRLVPPLRHEQAAALNTAFLRDVVENISLAALAASPHSAITAYAAYGPPGSEDFFRGNFPDSLRLIAAWLPNFGDCLLHTIREMFAFGHTAAVVLNADSPTLPTALLSETAEVLARPGDRAVLGPSSDGGYYLLGLKAAHQRLFEEIAWSTERVAGQTRERACEIGLDLHELPEWYDVDDLASLRRLHAELSGEHRAGSLPPRRARHTAVLLEQLWSGEEPGRRFGEIGMAEASAA